MRGRSSSDRRTSRGYVTPAPPVTRTFFHLPQAQEDVVRSYDLHASVHVSKPVDFGRYIEVVKQIDDFFGNVAELPT